MKAISWAYRLGKSYDPSAYLQNIPHHILNVSYVIKHSCSIIHVNRSELPNTKQASLKNQTTNSNLLPAQFPIFLYLPSELNKNYTLDFAFFFPVKSFNYRSISFYVSSCCNLASFFNVTHGCIVLFYSRSHTLQIPGF